MKAMLNIQQIPITLHLPDDTVMRRFGFEIAIKKLLKTFDSLYILQFTVKILIVEFLYWKFVNIYVRNVNLLRIFTKIL